MRLLIIQLQMMAPESELGSTESTARMEHIARTPELASLQSIVYPVFQPDPNYCPVLQIYSASRIDNAETGIQHQLFLTDGYHTQRAILARELNPMVESKQLDIKFGSIVHIHKYSLLKCVDQERKRLIQILDMEVQVANFDPIGKPLDFLTLSAQTGLRWNPEEWDERNPKWLDAEDVDRDDLDLKWEMGG